MHVNKFEKFLQRRKNLNYAIVCQVANNKHTRELVCVERVKWNKWTRVFRCAKSVVTDKKLLVKYSIVRNHYYIEDMPMIWSEWMCNEVSLAIKR